MNVAIGLSGGVDSGIAAYLLKQQGHDVTGIFMQNWHDDKASDCMAAYDLEDARTVADQLGIGFQVVDFSKAYKEKVFDQFLDQLSQGLTPNPDVFCNRFIKFEALRAYAKSMGADKLATGHYAQNKYIQGQYTLWQGLDLSKDQSYFLSMLRQDQLADSLFPLGRLQKSEVRQIADSLNLVNAHKKDSTGICFIGQKRFSDFITHYLLDKPGKIVSVEGRMMGTHRGLIYYTIGQRQGLGIGGNTEASDLPWYVVGKDPKTQTLTVAQGSNHPALFRQQLSAASFSWVSGAPNDSNELLAKIRYRQKPQSCRIELLDDGQAQVHFKDAQRAVTPGQIIVLYRLTQCLGAGVITA